MSWVRREAWVEEGKEEEARQSSREDTHGFGRRNLAAAGMKK